MAILNLLRPGPLVLGFFGASFLYGIYIVVYRLFFHPLAKYPGPFLAKVTSLYSAYHNYINDVHLDMTRCHAVYGDFVRYGPDRLLVNSVDGFHDIYAHGKNVTKSKAYFSLMPPDRTFSVLTAWDKTIHGRKRRVIGQGFTEPAVRGYEPIIKGNIDVFCKRLLNGDGTHFPTSEEPNTWSPPMNMSKFANYLSFDIMTDVTFSVKRHLMEKADYRWITSCIERTMDRIGTVSMVPWTIWWGLGFHWFIVPSGVISFLKFMGQVQYFIKERATNPPKDGRRDVYQNLLNAKDPETGNTLSHAELHSEAGVLIVAGSDTTSSAFAGIFFYLSRNPAVYARLAHEVRTTFSSASDIRQGPELRSCVYLHATVDECLRMAPPVSAALWRVVQRGGQRIDGHEVLEGTEVGTSLYSLMHNPAYFYEPYRFNPDRWIESETNSAEKIEIQRRAFAPFLIGARMCAAKNMAMAELTLAIAEVIFTMDFKKADGPDGELGQGRLGSGLGRERPEEFQLLSHFVTVGKKGPIVQFRKRVQEPVD